MPRLPACPGCARSGLPLHAPNGEVARESVGGSALERGASSQMGTDRRNVLAGITLHWIEHVDRFVCQLESGPLVVHEGKLQQAYHAVFALARKPWVGR